MRNKTRLEEQKKKRKEKIKKDFSKKTAVFLRKNPATIRIELLWENKRTPTRTIRLKHNEPVVDGMIRKIKGVAKERRGKLQCT